MARGSIFDLVDALYGVNGRGTAPLQPVNIGGRRTIDTKGGQPPGGVPITPPHNGGPPSGTPANPPPTKGGTPVDRPPGSPTPGPTTPPANPNPPQTPAIPKPPEQPTPNPTTPTPTSPNWTGSPSDFNKGQVREQQMPGGGYDPTMQALFGGGFKPYNGLVTGGDKGGQPGGGGWGGGGGGGGSGGGGWGDAGYHGGGQASTYDPLGIGQDNYYGGPYGGLPSSNQNVYNMTGVNAATGYQGPARYGVVGGQGGYGVGMVGPEYSGPIFDDARVALKALRQQRRRLENNDPIQATASPVAATAGVPATGSTTGGSSVDNKGGQPAGPNLLGRLNRINSKLAADPNNAALQARQQRVAGRIKGGQPAGGNTTAPAPAPASGLGAGLTPPAPQQGAWDPYTQGAGMGNMFDTGWGRLVASSTGNQNIMQLENDPTKLFHYDPTAQDGPGARGGWKSMTPESYASYGDYNYKDPRNFAGTGMMTQRWTPGKNGALGQGVVGTGSYA